MYHDNGVEIICIHPQLLKSMMTSTICPIFWIGEIDFANIASGLPFIQIYHVKHRYGDMLPNLYTNKYVCQRYLYHDLIRGAIYYK